MIDDLSRSQQERSSGSAEVQLTCKVVAKREQRSAESSLPGKVVAKRSSWGELLGEAL